MTLAEYAESLTWELAVWLENFFGRDCPIRQLGRLSMDLSRGLRSLAVLQLLADDDRIHFFRNLMQSARVRIHYLSKLQEAGIDDDHHQASARYRPFLDAVATGKVEIARQIVRLSPTDFREGHEYTDDYCFAQILMSLINNETDHSLYRSLLERYEIYLEGDIDPRFYVARALIKPDQSEFDDYFNELIQSKSVEIEKLKKGGQMEDAHVAAERLVFVDALAILQLAELRGLNTEREYMYCPSAVRDPLRAAF